MKRIVIFCFYDVHGIAGTDTIKQLEDLYKIADYLVVVVNGELHNSGDIKEYANKIIVRQNQGYDAGAYKTALNDRKVKDCILQSDELVFCNNTFWGPVVGSYIEIMKKMEKSNADFWGLVYVESPLKKQIQSYFMVFRKRIIESGDLYEYMDDYIDENTDDYYEVCCLFEDGIFEYLISKGYQYDAVIKQISCSIFANPYQLMVCDQVPIIKKKCFSSRYYNEEKCLMALAYVYQYTNYDVRLILEYINRVYGIYIDCELLKKYQIPKKYPKQVRPSFPSVTKEDIFYFISDKENIYIYGAGIVGKNVFYMLGKRVGLKGFIISDNQILDFTSYKGVPIYRLSEVNIGQEKVGIIVAMAQKNTRQVKQLLGDRPNVLYMWQ